MSMYSAALKVLSPLMLLSPAAASLEALRTCLASADRQKRRRPHVPLLASAFFYFFFIPFLIMSSSSSSRSPARLSLCRLEIQSSGLRFISPFLVHSRQHCLVLPHSLGLRSGTSSWVRSPPTCRRLPPSAACPAPEHREKRGAVGETVGKHSFGPSALGTLTMNPSTINCWLRIELIKLN